MSLPQLEIASYECNGTDNCGSNLMDPILYTSSTFHVHSHFTYNNYCKICYSDRPYHLDTLFVHTAFHQCPYKLIPEKHFRSCVPYLCIYLITFIVNTHPTNPSSV